jgi:adenosyl cobinamide kinase/adenosyl cobinamide phosphate guanylyltransferase
VLIVVTGGIGSGKSQFAAETARTIGREAIAAVCPAFPDEAGLTETRREAEGSFSWLWIPADAELAGNIDKINRESNFFRADRRVLVVDSLSGWLRQAVHAAAFQGADFDAGGRSAVRFAEAAERCEAALRGLTEALLAYEGNRVVVTEEACGGLVRDPWERWYVRQLADTNRRLFDAADAVYRLTAGRAAELKGKRLKRRDAGDETLHPYRR